jgi:hypothetical protein
MKNGRTQIQQHFTHRKMNQQQNLELTCVLEQKTASEQITVPTPKKTTIKSTQSNTTTLSPNELT